MVTEYNDSKQILGAFFEFFEWTYQVTLSAAHRERLRAEIYAGWSNSDESDHRLIGYVVHLHKLVFTSPRSEHDSLRSQALSLFKREISRPAGTDAARILAVLHAILEEVRPGCTGVKLIARAKTSAPERAPAPSAAPVQSPAAPAQQAFAAAPTQALQAAPTQAQAAAPVPAAPVTLAQVQALIQATLAQTAAVQGAAAQGGSATAPLQRYVAPPTLQNPAAAVAPAPASAQPISQFRPDPGFPDPRDHRAVLQWQQDQQHANDMLKIRSNWIKAQGEVSSHILGNM